MISTIEQKHATCLAAQLIKNSIRKILNNKNEVYKRQSNKKSKKEIKR